MAKRFFYVCTGIFLLALSYHLGARSVEAQAGASFTGFSATVWNGSVTLWALTPNGDVYSRPGGAAPSTPATLAGNFWGGATATTPQSWGQVKDRYRR